MEFFQRAIELDPGHAQAYAALAESYWPTGFYGFQPPKEVYPKAKDWALKALEIDAALAEGRTALAAIRFYHDWDWAGAEDEYRQVIDLNPNYAEAHRLYGYYLAAMGRRNDSLAEFSRARELSPVSLVVNTGLASGLFYAGEHNRAVKQLRMTLELDPNYAFGHFTLGRVYADHGQWAEAIREMQKALELSPGNSVYMAFLGNFYASAGNRGEALKILHKLQALSKQRNIRPADIAFIYVGLGDRNQAMRWFERGYEERDGQLVWLRAEPGFQPMRSDPRFQDPLRRMNFPQ